jgi:ATP synthase protein I
MVKIPEESHPQASPSGQAAPAAMWEDDDASKDLEPQFKPLTPEQAAAWRANQPQVDVWKVVAWQAGAGVLLVAAVAVFSGQWRLVSSVAWGAVAVVLPSAVFARAWVRQARLAQAGAALAGLFVWELVKILLTVVLLLVSPLLISQLSWLALLAGFVVTMKVSWVVMALGWWRRRTRKRI